MESLIRSLVRESFWGLSGLLMVLASTADARAAAGDMHSWTPTGATRLKQAAACHDISRDLYGVAAVFEMSGKLGRYDALYYLRVEGDSTDANYGELLDATLVETASRIDNVDCASSGGGYVFVAIDRFGDDAAWYRISGTVVYGPYVIDPPYCAPYSYRPRIAFGGDSNSRRLMVVVAGFNYDTGVKSCEICTQEFAPYTGSVVADSDNFIWIDGMHHDGFDVEWNGLDRFVVADPYVMDGGGNFLETWTYDVNGDLMAENLIQDFDRTPNPAYPSRTELVLSPNSRNPANKLLMQTTTGTYWLTQEGVWLGVESYAAGSRYASCEYWGSDNAIGTVFRLVSHYVYTAGGGYWKYKTERAHFGRDHALPYEVFSVNDNYAPEACDSGNTFTNPETLVVSSTISRNTNVYWNILSSDGAAAMLAAP